MDILTFFLTLFSFGFFILLIDILYPTDVNIVDIIRYYTRGTKWKDSTELAYYLIGRLPLKVQAVEVDASRYLLLQWISIKEKA